MSNIHIFESVLTPSGRRRHYKVLGVKVFSKSIKPQPKTARIARSSDSVLLIRRNDMGAGLMSHWATAVGWIAWARARGLLPYVDMRTMPNLFNRGTRGPVNHWECFFRQPDGVDVATLLSARHHEETGPYAYPDAYPYADPDWMVEGSERLQFWREIVRRDVWLSDSVERLVQDRFDELFRGDANVLGCLVRGTDYLKMKPAGHQVQPDPEQVVRDAREACLEFGLKRVFLATEDLSIQNLFRNEFGENLIINQIELPRYDGGYLVRSGAMGDGDRSFEISREYLVSIALLARCRYLLAGCTSGSAAAMLMSPGYAWSKIYSLGKYDTPSNF